MPEHIVGQVVPSTRMSSNRVVEAEIPDREYILLLHAKVP
jgi:hypothetical protein